MEHKAPSFDRSWVIKASGLNFLREDHHHHRMLVDKFTCPPIYKPKSTLPNTANILGQLD